MKDVAVIHWQDGTQEKQAKAYTIEMLAQTIQWAEKNNKVYWICITSGHTIIPLSAHKPVSATFEPVEYIDKVETFKQPYKPFEDVTRIDTIQHPKNREEVRKAYQAHI